MRKMLYILPLLPVLLATPALATGEATPDEAKAMAVKAADFLKSAGPEKAFAEFDAKEGPWHDRDLYVTVIDETGVVAAHGNNTALIGKNVLGLKDVDGKPFIAQFVAVKDAGWVNYKWQNPLTKAVEPKAQYNIHVGTYIVGVGAYAR
jgi:signal transduction histidine kinase